MIRNNPLKAVLPEDVHNEILEVIVADTLQEMANESKYFIQYLKESTQNKEYGSLIQICPLLRDIKPRTDLFRSFVCFSISRMIDNSEGRLFCA